MLLTSFSPAILILVTMETIVAAISSAGRGEIYGDYGDTAQATRLRQVNISDNVAEFLGNTKCMEILATKKNSSAFFCKRNFLSSKIELIKAFVCRVTESAFLVVSCLSAGARAPLTAKYNF